LVSVAKLLHQPSGQLTSGGFFGFRGYSSEIPADDLKMHPLPLRSLVFSRGPESVKNSMMKGAGFMILIDS